MLGCVGVEAAGALGRRPRILDAFCGAGGAAWGYWLAGFDVVGVDINPQPNYPFEFHQGDVLDVLDRGICSVNEVGVLRYVQLDSFDAVHASPPCQHYMRSGNVDRDKHPDLIPKTRAMLDDIGLPYVIENVPGAPMRADVVLCGSMFGLTVRRHRWFEFSDGMTRFPPFGCDHSGKVVGVYGNAHGSQGAAPGMLPGNLETWSEGLGIDWMTTAELALAIPPAYTEWVGRRLLEVLPVPVSEGDL